MADMPPSLFALVDTECMDPERRKELLTSALYHVWSNLPAPHVDGSVDVEKIRRFLADMVETRRFWLQVYEAVLKHYGTDATFQSIADEVNNAAPPKKKARRPVEEREEPEEAPAEEATSEGATCWLCRGAGFEATSEGATIVCCECGGSGRS